MPRSAVSIPPMLARRANRVLRPRDAADVYAQPRVELARLVRSGAVRRVATGYYALTPQDRLGDQRWRPELDAAALGVAQADYGAAAVALMGVSAARHHGAIPRALGVAVVATPKQRPDVISEIGRMVFVKRDIGRLDIERIETSLTTGWVTSIEQTLLDLAARPRLGGLTDADIAESIRALSARADWTLIEHLAADQHRPAALQFAARIAEVEHA